MCFFFQAEDGIRDLVRSRGLGDVYKRQARAGGRARPPGAGRRAIAHHAADAPGAVGAATDPCLLYTSDAADERSSVDLGGRRIITQKTNTRAHHATDVVRHVFSTHH